MSPYQPNDADVVLADFGEDITCDAVPAVTRALLDDLVQEGETSGRPSVAQVLVMRVKRGAFGTTPVQDTRVTLRDRNDARYKLDALLPRESSLFDYWRLTQVRS